MKKQIVRLMAMVLCLSMVFTCNVFAVSAESVDLDTRRILYGQLKERNALDKLDFYEDILNSLNAGIVPHGNDDEYINVYAEFGGTISYRDRRSGIDTAVVCLDRDNSYYWVLSQQRGALLGNIVMTILGYIPFAGQIATIVSLAQVHVSSRLAKQLQDNGGRVMLTSTSEDEPGDAPVASAWTRFPYLYLFNPNAYRIETEVFPEFDPFE